MRVKAIFINWKLRECFCQQNHTTINVKVYSWGQSEMTPMLTGIYSREWRAQNMVIKWISIKCDVSSFSFPQRTNDDFMHCKVKDGADGKWYYAFPKVILFVRMEEELGMGSIRYDDRSGNWEMKCLKFQVEMWSVKCTLWMLNRLIN